MSADEQLLVRLEARINDFEKQMKKAETTGTRTYQNLRRGSLSATRGMEQDMARSASSIRQSVASVGGSIGSLGKALAGGFLGGLAVGAASEFARSSRQVVRGIAEIGNAAKRAGLSAQAFQEWSFVAEQNRISVDALTDGFKELSLRADEFITTGAGPAAEAFTRMGFQATDLKRRLADPSKLMLEIMRRLEGFDKAAQIRIADEIFGGTGGERFVELLGQGQGALAATIDRAHETGAVLDAELIAKAEELDRKFSELTTRVESFGKRAVVAIADAAVEVTDLRARLDEVFDSEAEGRSVLGGGLYDALAANRDIVDEHAKALGQLEGQFQRLDDEATAAGGAIRGAIGQLDAWGYDEAADALRRLYAALEETQAQFARGEITGDEFATTLDEIQRSAQDAFAELEAGDRVQFGGVISQLQRLAGVVSGVITLANQMRASLANAAGVSPDQQRLGSMRKRQQVEAASMSSLDAMREANDKFTASEQARNAATADALKLEREVASVRKRATEAGAALTDAEALDFAQAALAGDAARSPGRSSGRGGKGASGGKSGGAGRADDFAREAEQIRERTTALHIEAQVMAEVAASGAEYGDAMEYARQKADLLHAAHQAGKQITPELLAEIEALAQGYVTAGMNAEQAAEKMNRIREQSERGRDALSDMFGSIIDRSASAKDAVVNLLAEIAKAQAIKGIMGLPGMGAAAGWLGGLLSFDGGGHTGNGSRSGGLDGKGGFLAMLHPRETVTDHSKGRQTTQQAQGGAMAVSIGFDNSVGGFTAMVRDEAGRVVAQAAPAIVGQSVGAVRRGSASSKAFLGLR